MISFGAKLSRKQELAIAALLSTKTIAEAAREAGVSEITLWRWLRRSDFQLAYANARREVVSSAIASLQQASEKAVRTLEEIMLDKNAAPSARVSAAKVVLELVLKVQNIEDLQRRLAAVEEIIEGWNDDYDTAH